MERRLEVLTRLLRRATERHDRVAVMLLRQRIAALS